MPLLLINDVQRTVENISENEWRVIRMLRLNESLAERAGFEPALGN